VLTDRIDRPTPFRNAHTPYCPPHPPQTRRHKNTHLVLPREEEALVGVVNKAPLHEDVEVEEQLVRRGAQQGKGPRPAKSTPE
jgi:hypothetical protein